MSMWFVIEVKFTNKCLTYKFTAFCLPGLISFPKIFPCPCNSDCPCVFKSWLSPSLNFSFIASCHQYFQTSHLQLASSITNNSCLILVSLNLLSSGSLLFLSINLFFGTGPCNYIIILYFGLIHFYFELMNQVKLVF